MKTPRELPLKVRELEQRFCGLSMDFLWYVLSNLRDFLQGWRMKKLKITDIYEGMLTEMAEEAICAAGSPVSIAHLSLRDVCL